MRFLAGFDRNELVDRVSRAEGDVPGGLAGGDEIIADASAEADAVGNVLYWIMVVLGVGDLHKEAAGEKIVEQAGDAMVVDALNAVELSEVSQVIKAQSG